MENWEQVFSKAEDSGVYPIEDDGIPDVRKAAALAGLTVFCLNLADVNGKAGFMRAIAKTLHFPHYFGSNWDALEDCLTDLSWLQAKGYVLLFQNMNKFDSRAPDEATMLRTILQNAAKYWKRLGVRFFAVLEGINPA